MKKITIFCILFFCVLNNFGQQISIKDWDEQAKTNIRLLPKYGYQQKTAEQKEADQEFVTTILAKDSTARKASDHLIDLGFKYLYRDVKTAMYRFNQAYLLDSTNTDIYWGYGGVYMTLGNYEKAQQQYVKGLSIDPKSTHLLTDYGTYFMAQYYGLKPLGEKGAAPYLDSAIVYLTRSYQLDPKDPNTTFKLSSCYYNKNDCENAWKFYDECKAVSSETISDEYTKALKKQCRHKR